MGPRGAKCPSTAQRPDECKVGGGAPDQSLEFGDGALRKRTVLPGEWPVAVSTPDEPAGCCISPRKEFGVPRRIWAHRRARAPDTARQHAHQSFHPRPRESYGARTATAHHGVSKTFSRKAKLSEPDGHGLSNRIRSLARQGG